MIKHFRKLSLISAITCGLLIQSTPASAEEKVVTCESNKNRYHYCEHKISGEVKLISQTSKTRCREDENWGFDTHGIWVDKGCSGEFRIKSKGGNSHNDHHHTSDSGGDTIAAIGGALIVGALVGALTSGSDNDSSSDDNIKCASTNSKYTRCEADIRRDERVVMKRQLSNDGCWEDETWGYDRDGIWVDEGCRAEFEIKRRQR